MIRRPSRAGAPFLVSLLLILAALPVTAQNTVRTVFIPDDFYIGDTVELRMYLPRSPGEKPSALVDTPEIEWGRLLGIRVLPGEDQTEVRLQFMPLIPGTHTLPSITIGTQRTGNIAIFVNSLASESQELAGLRPQVLMPGTILGLVLQVLVILLVGSAGTALYLWGRPLVGKALDRHRRAQPARTFLREHRAVAQGAGVLSPAASIEALSHLFRTYISRTLGPRVGTSTSKEMLENLQTQGLGPETLDRLAAGLFFTDQVRYGGLQPTDTQAMHHADLVLQAVLQLEAARQEGEGGDHAAGL